MIIYSDFDPVTTSYILQHVNQRSRMFRGNTDVGEIHHSYESRGGMIHVSFDSAEGAVSIVRESRRPKLRLVVGGDGR